MTDPPSVDRGLDGGSGTSERTGGQRRDSRTSTESGIDWMGSGTRSTVACEWPSGAMNYLSPKNKIKLNK